MSFPFRFNTAKTTFTRSTLTDSVSALKRACWPECPGGSPAKQAKQIRTAIAARTLLPRHIGFHGGSGLGIRFANLRLPRHRTSGTDGSGRREWNLSSSLKHDE